MRATADCLRECLPLKSPHGPVYVTAITISTVCGWSWRQGAAEQRVLSAALRAPSPAFVVFLRGLQR